MIDTAGAALMRAAAVLEAAAPNGGLMLRRLRSASEGPIFVFAVTRVVATALAVLGVVIFGLPDNTTAALIIGGVALPWTLLVLFITRREPEFALNPIVPIVDFLAARAARGRRARHGCRRPRRRALPRGLARPLPGRAARHGGGRLGSAALVIATQIRGDEPVDGDLFAFYELVFVVAALATGLVVGTLRTAESASRLRAKGLSRRTIQAEGQVRRRWPRRFTTDPSRS